MHWYVNILFKRQWEVRTQGFWLEQMSRFTGAKEAWGINRFGWGAIEVIPNSQGYMC
jgi:hypothetical protein